jgi:hypothetical protein
MTRKDYVMVADSIKASRENWEGFTPEAQEAIDGLARSLASKLAQDKYFSYHRLSWQYSLTVIPTYPILP